jgi:hypothetical protein
MVMASARSAAATRIRPAVTANAMTLEPRSVVMNFHLPIYVKKIMNAAMEHAANTQNAATTEYAKVLYVIIVNH